MKKFVIFLFFVFVFGFYYFFYINSKISLNVYKIKKNYMPGEKINFDIIMKNLSKREKCYALKVSLESSIEKISYPEFVCFIKPDSSKTFDYYFTLSTQTINRDCKVNIEVKTRYPKNEKTILTKLIVFNISSLKVIEKMKEIEIIKTQKPEQKVKLIQTKPQTEKEYIETKKVETPKTVSSQLKANIKFKNIPDEIYYNEKLPVIIEVENVSNYSGELELKLEIIPSSVLSTTLQKSYSFSKKIFFNQYEKKEIPFDYMFNENNSEGEYLITGEIFSLYKNSYLSISSDNFVLKLINKSPSIIITSSDLFVKPKQTIKYVAEVSDDTGVKTVEFCMIDLKKQTTQYFQMELISGTTIEGLWKYETKLKKDKDFCFFIKAIDSKKQFSTTEKFTVNVSKK